MVRLLDIYQHRLIQKKKGLDKLLDLTLHYSQLVFMNKVIEPHHLLLLNQAYVLQQKNLSKLHFHWEKHQINPCQKIFV